MKILCGAMKGHEGVLYMCSSRHRKNPLKCKLIQTMSLIVDKPCQPQQSFAGKGGTK